MFIVTAGLKKMCIREEQMMIRPQCWEKKKKGKKIKKEAVQNYLDELNAYKLTGPDVVHARVHKELANAICQSLIIIFKNLLKR